MIEELWFMVARACGLVIAPPDDARRELMLLQAHLGARYLGEIWHQRNGGESSPPRSHAGWPMTRVGDASHQLPLGLLPEIIHTNFQRGR